MRCGAVQSAPVAEVVNTRSFVEQLLRKRQSSHTTKIFPSPAISADGSSPLRIPPGSVFAVMLVIVVTAPKLAPPFVEVVNPSDVSLALSSGTTTFPFGSTTGWPPITPVEGVLEGFHVRPPSVEKEI